jgi:hypothetical protein
MKRYYGDRHLKLYNIYNTQLRQLFPGLKFLVCFEGLRAGFNLNRPSEYRSPQRALNGRPADSKSEYMYFYNLLIPI